MTVKNDGNFGSEPDHQCYCFAKGELANNFWKSITTDSQKIKIKNWFVSIGFLHTSIIMRNQSSSLKN